MLSTETNSDFQRQGGTHLHDVLIMQSRKDNVDIGDSSGKFSWCKLYIQLYSSSDNDSN